MGAGKGAAPGRICFVTADFAGLVRNGGIGTYTSLMSHLLTQHGWLVHILFCGPADDESAVEATRSALLQSGIGLTWLEEAGSPPWRALTHHGEGERLEASQYAFEMLERLHAEHRFDLIEFADWRALGFRSIQAKRLGLAFDDTRLAVKLHSPTDWQRRGNLAGHETLDDFKIDFCERYAFEHADVQLSPSAYMVRDAREQGWAVRDDLVVSYPFPDPLASPHSGGGGLEEIVFFGRLELRKGIDLFLDALDLLDAVPPVLFLGRDAELNYRHSSEVIAERMGNRAFRIETGLGRDAALTELQRGGRLVVLPSRAESFGFTVAECLVNEIPFVAARSTAIPEVVRHPEAQTRWLFEPTPDGLAEAIRRRLETPEGEDRALRGAAAQAADPASWNRRVEEAYRGLAARPLNPVPESERGTVTVAVTYHEHPEYLPGALASLAAQERAPDEVLVIDDGSTSDEALRVFSEEESRYPEWTFLRQTNAGPGAARNECLRRAKGSHFLPFDSDNLATPWLVRDLLAAATTTGDDIITCQTLAFVEDKDVEAASFRYRYSPTGGPRLLTLVENVFGDTCALMRTDTLRAAGGYEAERWSPHEDWETYTKLVFSGARVDVVPRVLFHYRTAAEGRLDRLTADAGLRPRFRRRMLDEFLLQAQLTDAERLALWECMVGFSEPPNWKRLLRDQEDLLAWTDVKFRELNEWREREVERVRAWKQREIDDAAAWHHSELEGLRTWLSNDLEGWRRGAEAAQARADELAAELMAIRGKLTAAEADLDAAAQARLADYRSRMTLRRRVLGAALTIPAAAWTAAVLRRRDRPRLRSGA